VTLRERVRTLALERGLTLRDLAAVAFPDAPSPAAGERRLDRMLKNGTAASYAILRSVADCLGMGVDEMLEGVVG